MTNNSNTYNQPPMGQRMMPPPLVSARPQAQREKWGRRLIGQKKTNMLYPKWIPEYAVAVYFIALVGISYVYTAYSLPWYYMLSGIVAVLMFFLYGGKVINDTAIDNIHSGKRFERRIFLIAFIPRVMFMLLLYWIFQANYGEAFGFENRDPSGYDHLGYAFKEAMSKGRFLEAWKEQQAYLDVSDMGYAVYLGLIYWLTGASGVTSFDGIGADSVGIIAARLMKCIWSSITIILIYRLAKRNFGEQTGRTTAVFAALWPNFWYCCGTHLKEAEMVFLAVLFVEQADQMLRSRRFTAWKIIPILLIAAAMFTVRTPLGLVALLALVFSVVMSSSRVVAWGKRIIVGILAIMLMFVVAGNRIEEQTNELLNRVQMDEQQQNLQWRGERDDGNTFAKYAGASVFAPMIFTLPFPTLVRPFDGQEVQQLLNGGNFIKNIISFFTILSLVMLLIYGKWRDHLLPLSFMLGYLVVLTMSTFAHSERFHQPAMPFEMMFAAYGLSIALMKKKYKRWFTYWCVLMFVAAIAWNWFKLSGRGLV